MKRSFFRPRILYPVIAVTLAGAFGTEYQSATAQQELSLQASEHPFGRLNPAAPPETEQWGQIAGRWNCIILTPRDDGTTFHSEATWTWTYALDGYAVQDQYVGSSRNGRPPFRGTALRSYNSNSGHWEIAWADNSNQGSQSNKIHWYTAVYEDGEIIMADAERPDWSTVFYNISKESFDWKNEPSGQSMTCARSP